MPSLSSAKARRTAARLSAVQALYQLELGDGTASSAMYDLLQMRQDDIEEQLVDPDQTLLTNIIEGVQNRLADVDALVSAALEGRGIERAEAVLRAIYRAGTFELMSDGATPVGIIINDYMNVAHAFFTEGEHTKVNAVLDAVARALGRGRDEGQTTASPAGM